MASKQSTSSFKPKGKLRVVQLPGARISVHNSQLLISTGVPSLDSLFGGGVPVGSLIILCEDNGATYANLFVKCFLAEGVVYKHKLYLSCLDKSAKNILKNLPAPDADKEKSDNGSGMNNDDAMKIAWRYQNQKKHSSPVNSLGHNYDIKSKMSEEMLKDYMNSFWTASSNSNVYKDLYKSLHQEIDSNKLFTKYNKMSSNVMRIVVESIGSGMWGDEAFSDEQINFRKLSAFMIRLRGLVRKSFSVALVTLPSKLFSFEPLHEDICRAADFVIGLESFEGTDKEVNPVFKDYHGLLHLNKISPINSLPAANLDESDWVFKLKRKKLVVEKLHIPPDLSETASRTSGNENNKHLSCSSALDF